MKLHLNNAAGQNLFTAHGQGYVAVNGVRHERGLIVTPEQLIEPDRDPGFEELDAAYFEALLALRPEIILLGTGARLRFPAPALTACLAPAHIGLEVMDTGALCRTYNILASEGRAVAAAVLLR